MKHKPLSDQVIVITGASSGIGLCTAILAVEQGAQVVIAARSTETLQQIRDALSEAQGKVHALTLDVADRHAVDQAASEVAALFGRIDTWVNNAGVAIYGRLDEVDDADSRRLFDVNFWGVVNGSLSSLPFLQASGGVLVNVGSEVSEAVVPLQGMYSASKHAVKGFTDALRVEQERVEGKRLEIVLIQPTGVDTPYPEHARNYMEQEPKLPAPLIDPRRVAEAILHAAEHGGRDQKVGAMAHLNVAMTKLLPRLADRMSAMQANRQQRAATPVAPAGTLFTPGESGRVYGIGSERNASGR